MSDITITKNNVKIAEAFNMTDAEVSVIKDSVAKGTTDMELAYFIRTCQSMELNPFNKEVWCYKDNRNNLLIFAGRDGFLAKAQKNPLFNGIRSCEVCENDDIRLNIPMGVVEHTINPKEPRGGIIGAYAFVFRKDGEPTVEYVDFATYNKGHNAWKSHPAEMIKKVAETHALKKAFGIALQVEYDWNVVDGVAEPIETSSFTPDSFGWDEAVRSLADTNDLKTTMEAIKRRLNKIGLTLDAENEKLLNEHAKAYLYNG